MPEDNLAYVSKFNKILHGNLTSKYILNKQLGKFTWLYVQDRELMFTLYYVMFIIPKIGNMVNIQ